ncbi:hypothetical protein [Escherichia phage slur04]|uniref:Long tail fiber protein Gp37 n=2 Tax=Tequatrovirus slur02 TaxID=2956502 RepID=A0A0M7Q9Y7_9CAUD|nr:long tail fiber protein distal subunit [Escherichia phage slur02]YP_009625465.1 long tail fiber protein distal subunit [Escherichia phage slur04]CUL01211.1 unnamed protein product [Escherichia phage slur02]CUL02091.1 hypothetical protein [Escherichia phage slur04]CUL03019.1 hypothetical protein [Escherichia phage slur11]
MATLKQIQFKRSKTAGARPAASVLAEGELAINLKDRTIFTKDDSGNIIDLGIAKGGQIDGNVTINGLLRLNGDYVQTGGMTVNGPIGSTDGVTAKVFRSTQGSFYARATNDTANAHLWFENTNGSERGVLYSKPQSENEGVITMRVRQGTAAGAQNSEFHFISTDGGIFQARKLTALTSISTPTISVNLINHDSKSFGQYDSQSLVNYVYPGTGETNGVNYLRKVRAKSGGTIYHEIVTAQTGLADEVSWWTGNTPLFKLYGIRNDGRMIIRNSLAIGTVTQGFPSSDYGNVGALGNIFLALGDNGTGLVYRKTGVFDFVGSGLSLASITPDSFRSTRKAIFGRSEDQGTTWIMPGTNAAFLSVQTQADENTAGDGQTHIGYNSGGKMNHYFRGKGKTNINTQEGMEVNPGILKLVTGSNNVQFYADGTVSSIQRIKFDNGLVLTGARPDGIQLDAPTTTDGTKTILWAGGTRPGQNKSYLSIKAWGNAFNTSGDRARESVFEVADGQGYYFYAQRVAPAAGSTTGVVQFRIAGALLTGGGITSSGSIVTESSLVANNGMSVNGQAKFGGTANALRIWNAEYGAIFRRSESNFYIIPTNQNEGESGDIHSSLRPVRIGLSDGMVGLGRDSFIVDQNNALTTINSNSRINANFRMQLGQSTYIDAECTDAVRPAGAGSFASQNNENVRAPFYMNINRTDTSTYVPIVKQRYVQNNSCYSIGTLINGGNFRVHYHEGGDGGSTGAIIKDLGWEFNKNGDFYSPGKLGAGNIRIGTDGNITGGSGNFANLNTTLNRKVTTGWINYSSVSGWYKLATVTMPQGVATVQFKITGGSGFNVGIFEQATINEIVLRSGNNTPKGINGVLWQRETDAIKDIAYINTSGDEYDVYISCGTYLNRLTIEYSTSENASVVVHGLYGPTQSPVEELPVDIVKGRVFKLLNNSSGVFDAGSSNISTNATFVANTTIGYRHKSNGDESGSAAALFYNDGTTFHILLTDKNTDTDKTKASGSYNSLRPFSINIASGKVTISNSMSVSGVSEFYNGLNIKNNGSINFDKSGANPRNMRIFHAGDASRGNRIEIADETNYIAYFEKTPGGANRFVVNNATVAGVNQMNSFGININNALGGNSIAFGDNDTGIKQNGDGLLDIYANGVQTFRFQNGDLYSYKNINAPNVYIRSDIRLKSNFKPIENALDKVEKLNGVIYDKAEYIGGEAIETEAGIVAQTLQDVLPEAVRETEDSKGNKILTVSSQAQIALLVEAVKTLSSRVKELESKLM